MTRRPRVGLYKNRKSGDLCLQRFVGDPRSSLAFLPAAPLLGVNSSDFERSGLALIRAELRGFSDRVFDPAATKEASEQLTPRFTARHHRLTFSLLPTGDIAITPWLRDHRGGYVGVPTSEEIVVAESDGQEGFLMKVAAGFSRCES